MAPKKKAQKIALSDFFNQTADAGSWADDEDIVLPSAPAYKDPSAPKRGDPGYLDSMPNRSDRTFPGAPSVRPDIPLPTAPPYTAYVGGLAYESSDVDIKEHFADLNPTSVRLVKDATGKSKGFGYIEFAGLDGLKSALDRSGEQLGGRTLRISVAEAPSNRKEFTPSAAEESNQWRRAGPLPTRAAPDLGPRRTTGGPIAGSQFSSAPEAERDWGSARGAKFTPAAPSPVGPPRREGSGGGFRREEAPHQGPSAADDASAWRSSRPMAAAPVAAPQEVQTPSLADTEVTWSRGTKLRTPVDSPSTTAPASPAVNSAADGERDWRRPAAVSRNGSQEGEVRPAPTERKKLTLAARSTSTTTSAAPSTAPSPRASIFGGAKPIDSAAKEAAAADKIAAADKERRAALAKAKADEESKSNSLAQEKERMIREAQEKAMKEAGLPVPERKESKGPSPRPQQQQQQQQQAAKPKIGPAPANAWGRGTATAAGAAAAGKAPQLARPVSGNGTTANGNGTAQPPREPKKKEEKQFDEDGFEVTGSGSRKGKAVAPASTASPSAAPVQQKSSAVKAGFSWSSVARGLDEPASKAGSENGDVEKVEQGVEGVKI